MKKLFILFAILLAVHSSHAETPGEYVARWMEIYQNSIDAACSFSASGKSFVLDKLMVSTDYSCGSGCSTSDATYYINVCQNVKNTGCTGEGKTTPICQKTGGMTPSYYSCGTLSDASASLIDESDPSKGLKVKYGSGDTCHKGQTTEHARSATMYFECGTENKGVYHAEQTASDDCGYDIHLQSPSCCPHSGGGGGGEEDEKKCNFGCHFVNFLGWLFLILMFCCTGMWGTIYLTVGALVQAFLRKPPRRGLNIIPTKDFIFSIPFVFKDSFVFVYTYTIGLIYKLIMNNVVKKKSGGGGGGSAAPSKGDYEQFD